MPGSQLRQLALDGSGVHGLSALIILEQGIKAVDIDALLKPCHYYDMIDGIGNSSTKGTLLINGYRNHLTGQHQLPDLPSYFQNTKDRIGA
ncbi:hypothetical protein P171DRAFT_485748 [Karstenula rhodostoma CBS 690.94]|uniref:Uncharacterized protein n=1 Tax=Karstenula rhodostoma CBS 690.94 TaxID=1392251 RepID=A0A9P4UCL5_9PLEO|nr:hypothetical protein P171DRAFT_485748 [Karstenula rhodostoma CBS 690.94]